MVKATPVLGTIVLVGAVGQLVLGFEVAGGLDTLRGLHVLFGVVGLVLVFALLVIAFRAKTSTIYSKVTIAVLAIVVLIQVGLGSQLLGGPNELMLPHEVNGFLIILLALVMGGITTWTARRRSNVAV